MIFLTCKFLCQIHKLNLIFKSKNNIKFKAIGDLSRFSKSLQNSIKNTEIATSNCMGLTQVLALNYGSKNEIIRAVKKLNEQTLSFCLCRLTKFF